MKLGPLDLRIHAFVYAAIIVVLLIVLLRMYFTNTGVRLEGLYRSTIIGALNTESAPAQEDGVNGCKTLIASNPSNGHFRLYLGTLLLKEKKFVEAEAAFREAGELASATPEQRAYGYVGAGVARFRALSNDEPGKYATAAAEAEKLFQKAVDAQKTNGDAIANLAFARALQKPKNASDFQKMCDDALAANPPPGLYSLQQLYALKGLGLLQEGKSEEAQGYFDRAKAIGPIGLPGLPDPKENVREGMLSTIVQATLPEPQRLEMLKAVEQNLSIYGNQQTTVLNALGIARWMMKDSSDYPKKYFKDARTNFNTAISREPKDPRAYVNQASLIEDRIAELARALTTPVTGLSGEPTPPNPWVETGPKAALPEADRAALAEINGLLGEENTMWETYFNKADVTTEDRVTSKLRQLACVRRMGWVANEASRPQFQARALSMADDLIKLNPEDVNSYFAQAEVLIEQGNTNKAFAVLNFAKTKGLKSPVVERLLGELGSKPVLTQIKPSGRWFGATPLISATLMGVNLKALQGLAMRLDGREVQGSNIGSQVMYVPQTDELKDGKHTVGITINDGVEPITLPDFSFIVNKKPPQWEIKAVGGDSGLLPQPTWTIVLTDEAGIDYSSITITLKNAAGGFKRVLIKEGRYDTGMPKIEIKAGDRISTDTFKLSSGTDLPTGSYTISIEVLDNAGNKLADTSRTFDVK